MVHPRAAHLQLVSDFAWREHKTPSTMDDYITIISGWQIAFAIMTLSSTSMALGAATAWWLSFMR